MTATIALFDIDGTLLRAGGAGSQTLRTVFRERFGSDAERIDLSVIDFAGRTDPWIVRTALGQAEIDDSGGVVDEILERYEALLPDELPRTPKFRLCDGAPEFLASLEGVEGLALGLGTGNTEGGAWAKLRYAKLDHYFAFGGYGSDSEDRAELLHCGALRGAHAVGRSLEDCRVVVIGDTPHDVTAARAIGADAVVAVSTGVRPLDVLEAAGADVAVATLLDPRARQAVVGNTA